PSIEGPEVDLLPDFRPDPVQPRNPGMGGAGHLSRNTELKIALGRGGPSFRNAEFVPRAGSGVARAKPLDGGMVLVGRPVFHEVSQEVIPVAQPVPLKIGERE